MDKIKIVQDENLKDKNEEPIINFAREGLKLGKKIGFISSIAYAVVGLFAVELFGEGIGFSSLTFESIIFWVAFIFVTITSILLLAITPATIIGALTGMCLGMLAKLAQRKHISKYFFVLLCALFCIVAVILIHLLFQIPITLSFEPPSYEFTLGTYDSYPFIIGIPSIIYVFIVGWCGQLL